MILCWFKITTLAELIQFTGAFVASTIWPIAAGLYWPHLNRHAAVAGMVLGTAAGLTAYFAIGFYTAALVGAAVSMLCVVLGTWMAPQGFDWRRLAALRAPGGALMQVPVVLFEIGLWGAVLGVAIAAAYLLTVLVYEWVRKKLW